MLLAYRATEMAASRLPSLAKIGEPKQN